MAENSQVEASGPKAAGARFSVVRQLRSFRFAVAGLVALVRREHNARIHLAATAVVILAGFVLQVGLDDWRWLIAAIALVWVVEALNTGLEHIADATCPEDNALIGIAKDVGAGATLIAAIAAALIGAITFAPYVLRQWPA